MSIILSKTVNFGSNKGSITTVGYKLLDALGELSGSRVTSGIGEIVSGAGIYSASIFFSNSFSGSILWDTGEASPLYAGEEYNPVEENIDFTRQMTAGKWEIDATEKHMIFYKEDNVTEIARYSLKDRDSNLSFDEVFKRTKL